MTGKGVVCSSGRGFHQGAGFQQFCQGRHFLHRIEGIREKKLRGSKTDLKLYFEFKKASGFRRLNNKGPEEAGSVSFRRFKASFLQHIRSGEYCFGPGLHSRLLQWTLIQVCGFISD